MPTKFDFVSPGIELREIDQSAIAEVPENDGLLLIGRAKKGPAMKPIKITSLTDFQSVFGTPMDGVKRGDPWREGNSAGGGWAAYAAEAYLAADIGPVKFIRLAGVQSDDAANDDTKKAGWTMNETEWAEGGAVAPAQVQGALGIFVGEDTVPEPDDAATATLTVATATDASPGDTIVIQDDTGADITFTFVASNPANSREIDLSLLNLGNENQNLSDLLVNAIDAEPNLSASNNSTTTITISQPAGLDGNDKTISEVFGGSGSTIFSESLPLAFEGGTVVTPTSNAVLAAIVYTDGSNLLLTGDLRDGTSNSDYKSAHAVKPSSGVWSARLDNGTSGEEFDFSFNFTSNSQNFIRNVMSTDATLTDDTVNPNGWNGHKVFLGESFENNVAKLSGNLYAWVAPIGESGDSFVEHREELAGAKTGWFIGSDASNYKRLFRLVALDEGSDFHKTHIVRIKDLRKATVVNPEASFTIQIAKVGAGPNDYEDIYPNVTLNPDSPNYIEKVIGNVHQYWDADKRKIITEGSFTNRSDLVRVEISPGGVNKTDLPLGFMGPAKIKDVTIRGTDTDGQNEWIWGGDVTNAGDSSATLKGLFEGDEVLVKWPTHQLAIANSYINNTNYPPSAIMGLSYDAQRGLEDFADIGVLKSDWNPHLDYTAAASQAAYFFSLEKMNKDNRGLYYYDSTYKGDFETLLGEGVRQFAAPFFGGTDGLNIKYDNPFNEARLEADGYERYSLQSAIYQVADYYTSRYDLISIPGVTNTTIIKELVRQTEARGDALAIVDLKGIFQSAVDSGTDQDTEGSVKLVVDQVEGGFASSYAAAYYPNVRIADVSSDNGSVLMAPPSVAAIGAIAKSEAVSQPWFAPAGFNRGGLAPLGGTGGANVVGTLEHLSKADRDNLYNVNINPIARFPATGDTVIFGQKTLQPSKTALDRINVRRMMIYLKKRIGGIADQFLFEQGVKATYDSFKAQINPILLQVKNEFGITDYKVILDETTTTPDLQDRNIMYAKVYVKPAKAIEYVVIDFVVTQSGVEFQ
jgi:hypothetical protein